MSGSVKVATKWGKVLLFGDSITQQSFTPEGCWGSLLADFLGRRCDVVVRGFSGYNTRFCKLILPEVFNADMAKDVVAMTIFLGANDACSFEKGANQFVSLEDYQQNLRDMVNYSLSVGLRRDQVILITPPAFYQEAWDAHCVETGKVPGSRTSKRTETYAAACCQVAKEMGTPHVDIYTEMMKNVDFKSYLRDGLHFSPSGSELLFKQLQPVLSQLVSHIPEMLFPYWSDIDNTDTDSSKRSLTEAGWLGV